MAAGIDIAFRINAFAVAMAAKNNSLDLWEVAALQIAAEDHEDPEDPVVRAALKFATSYDWIGQDKDALREAGDRLANAIERANRPDPINAHRKDIHG
ncbi:MAG: hypothetical protein AAFR53_06230 [Pseudomonadota bacterium]